MKEDAMTKINRKFAFVAGLGFMAASIALALPISTAVAQELSNETVGWVDQGLLQATTTAGGQPLKLLPRDGKPQITIELATVEPGGHTGVHSHPVPIVVYVLEGELEARHSDMVHRYKAGDVVIEPVDTPMQAVNPGSVPTKLLIVIIGEEGLPNGVAVQ
jgi:quercetin dioxygenase-like cupin family protein